MTYWFAISNFHHCWRSVQTAFFMVASWHCIIITLSRRGAGQPACWRCRRRAHPSHSYRDFTLTALRLSMFAWLRLVHRAFRLNHLLQHRAPTLAPQ